MSADPWFVDTNVLVYAFDDDSPDKRKVARRLLDDKADQLVLSAQGARRVLRHGDPQANQAASRKPRRGSAGCTLRVSGPRAGTGHWYDPRCAEAHPLRFPIGTPLIIESALDAGATVLLTEDLQHGQRFEALRVVNPFSRE